MSVVWNKWDAFWDALRRPELSPAELRVLLALVVHGRVSWASKDVLAAETGLSVKSVGKALTGLTARGLIVSEQRGPFRWERTVLIPKDDEVVRPA